MSNNNFYNLFIIFKGLHKRFFKHAPEPAPMQVEKEKDSGLVKNNPRKTATNLFQDLMDAKPDPSRQPKLDAELKSYRASVWTNDEKVLIKSHGPLLFYKQNEIDYLILCECARAVFCVMPSSTPIESVFSGCKQTVSPLRTRTRPSVVKDLTCLRRNRNQKN